MGPRGRITHVIVDWDRFMQVMYLGRAPRTKETLPDFLKWRQVTRHPLVFRGLTGSQRTPGIWGVTLCLNQQVCIIGCEQNIINIENQEYVFTPTDLHIYALI